jgi:dihydrofolate reductase
MITMGKPIVMGRRTHASIGRPLPGRRNVVLSRDRDYAAQGCEVFAGLPAALTALADQEEVMIIGGAALYAEALPLAHRLYVTDIDADISGDLFFPDHDAGAWREVSAERHAPDDTHAWAFCFRVLERINQRPPR